MKGLSEDMQTFLISAYFGDVTADNLKEICVERAYRDACRRIPYKYSAERVKQDKDKAEIKEFVQKKKMFYSAVEKILSEVKSSDTPAELIEAVKKEAGNYNEIFKEYGFTYGLAQKWVNMTLKYLWLFGECPIKEEELDVPLDRYIIRAITCKSTKNEFGINVAVKGLKSDMSWSKLDQMDLYEKIQNAIQTEIVKKDFHKAIGTKIRWENLAWTEQEKIEE